MYVLGVDIGSSASKAVIMDEKQNIISTATVLSGTGTKGPSMVFEQVLAAANLTEKDITYILATGYGRFVFPQADGQRSEISCHAKGMLYLLPEIRTIVDIGGQDVKAIKLNEKGMVLNFSMNDKCAAGTGRFLEMMAKILGVAVSDLGDIAQEATGIVEISNTCTVFAESEVISQLANNVKVEDLVAGIHQSVAKRVAALAYRNGINGKIAMSGGGALNKGLVKALSEELKAEIYTHDNCQLAGAIGAAITALDEVKADN